MTQFPIPALSGISREPVVDVYIDGQRHARCRVTKISDSAGVEPSECTILFPAHDYRNRPCDEGDRVQIWVNRLQYPNPFYNGFVTGFGDYLTLETGQYVEVFCQDDFMLLNHVFCETDFNLKDSRDEDAEVLTIRNIAAYFNTIGSNKFGSQFPNIVSSSFPTDWPGEVKAAGQPLDTLLSTLLDLAATYKYFVRRNYKSTGTDLFAFRDGQGEIAHIRYGTDYTKGPQAQNIGAINAGEVRRTERMETVINRGEVIGDRKVLETAIPLTAAWDSTKETYLDNLQAFTEEGTDDDPNPHYDPEAERIGKAFRFGKLPTGLGYPPLTDYPELEPRLIVDSPFGYSAAGDDFGKPFVVYRYGAEATYYVTWEFQLKDNEVITRKPLIRDNPTISAAMTHVLPSAAWIEAAYKLRDPLRVTLSKQGSVNRSIYRQFQKTDFKYKYRSAYFSLYEAAYIPTGGSGTISTTSYKVYASYNAGTSVEVNDTTDAQTWGAARLRATRDSQIEVTYEMPRMDMNYRVGMQVYENGVNTETQIFGIEYDFTRFHTTVRAVSR